MTSSSVIIISHNIGDKTIRHITIVQIVIGHNIGHITIPIVSNQIVICSQKRWCVGHQLKTVLRQCGITSMSHWCLHIMPHQTIVYLSIIAWRIDNRLVIIWCISNASVCLRTIHGILRTILWFLLHFFHITL